LLFALRPEQWIKNLFISLPLFFGKKLFAFPANFHTLLAIFLFSIACSSAYLINDIIDLKKDKFHPAKHLRPIVSGKISVKLAKIISFMLAVLSVSLSFKLDMSFGWIVASYLIFNLIYSNFLKELVVIDVFCIAVFFFLRIFAGIVIAQSGVSYWIVSMVVLIVLFMGFNKRLSEIRVLEEEAISHRRVLAKYNMRYINQASIVIIFLILIGYVLYTINEHTLNKFGTYHLAYTIPFVYFGIFRYNYLIHRTRVDGDPTRILFSDMPLQLSIASWILVCTAVIYFGF
jgi:4-hydroxybenzoate polyprenyltransferase